MSESLVDIDEPNLDHLGVHLHDNCPTSRRVQLLIYNFCHVLWGGGAVSIFQSRVAVGGVELDS